MSDLSFGRGASEGANPSGLSGVAAPVHSRACCFIRSSSEDFEGADSWEDSESDDWLTSGGSAAEAEGVSAAHGRSVRQRQRPAATVAFAPISRALLPFLSRGTLLGFPETPPRNIVHGFARRQPFGVVSTRKNPLMGKFYKWLAFHAD